MSAMFDDVGLEQELDEAHDLIAELRTNCQKRTEENERLLRVIETAVNRLEDIDARGGGTAWLKAKELLGGDLFLILYDLKGAITPQPVNDKEAP